MALTPEEQAQLEALLSRQAEAAAEEEQAADVADTAVELAEAAAEMAEAAAEVVAAVDPDPEPPAPVVVEAPSAEEVFELEVAHATGDAIRLEAEAAAQVAVIEAQAAAQVAVIEAELGAAPEPSPVVEMAPDDEPPKQGGKFLRFWFGG